MFSGHYQNVAHGSPAHRPVPDPHGAAVRQRRGGGQEHDPEVGLPAEVLLRSVRLRSGELFRNCRHQGLCEGGQGADGL